MNAIDFKSGMRLENRYTPFLLSLQTNLTPSVVPLRQTAWHRRPVRASRENASWKPADAALASSTSILAPVADRSMTVHGRLAKPPSRMIHADCRTDLRLCRFFSASIMCSVPRLCTALLFCARAFRGWSGCRNRTCAFGLENHSSTIELHPHHEIYHCARMKRITPR